MNSPIRGSELDEVSHANTFGARIVRILDQFDTVSAVLSGSFSCRWRMLQDFALVVGDMALMEMLLRYLPSDLRAGFNAAFIRRRIS